jgi:predicted ATPase/DNA-binding SARP family transcriptional activator
MQIGDTPLAVGSTGAVETRSEFRILGTVEAVRDGAPLTLGGPRHRRLLAALLVHAGEVLSAGRLIDALWGASPPRSAPAMLHVRVSELRAALRATGTELLTQHGGYLLGVPADGLDSRRFERLAVAGASALARGDLGQAGADLRGALTLWRGAALAEFAHAPFARAEAARLDELRLQAMENRVTADLGLGRHHELVAELEQLVAENPLRERLRGQLMLALYRSGRQAEALSVFHAAGVLMAEQLGLDPGVDLRRMHAAMLRQDPVLNLPAVRPVTRPGNLPAALTPLIGRDGDVREVRVLLREHRLVTLTGVGGAGKSRLAVEVATACQPDLRGGTWLVQLESLSRRDQPLTAAAAALGVSPDPDRPVLDVLAEHIGTAGPLLLFDTCEHLVDEVADAVDSLLRRCPGLRILVTSRERLGISGERVRPVGGLGLPEPDADLAAIGRADAVRFLADRVAAVQPGIVLTEETAGALAEICRRLDGLPLALELAATAVAAWGLDPVAAGLNDRFRLLTRGSRSAPARHRTLRAMVEWSYQRLDAAQRKLFERLVVLRDGFTVRDVEAACGDPTDGGSTDGGWSGVAALANLVDKSLVTVVHGGAGEPRYRVPETLRAYAVQCTGEAGG